MEVKKTEKANLENRRLLFTEIGLIAALLLVWLRECASRLGGHRLSSHDWMVGDSWTDMQAAANAGVKGAFCTFGFGRLNDSRFTVKINRFEELLRHLKAEE